MRRLGSGANPVPAQSQLPLLQPQPLLQSQPTASEPPSVHSPAAAAFAQPTASAQPIVHSPAVAAFPQPTGSTEPTGHSDAAAAFAQPTASAHVPVVVPPRFAAQPAPSVPLAQPAADATSTRCDAQLASPSAASPASSESPSDEPVLPAGCPLAQLCAVWEKALSAKGLEKTKVEKELEIAQAIFLHLNLYEGKCSISYKCARVE